MSRDNYFDPKYVEPGHTLTEFEVEQMRAAFEELQKTARSAQALNRKLVEALDPKNALVGFCDDKFEEGLLYAATKGREAFANWVNLKTWLTTRREAVVKSKNFAFSAVDNAEVQGELKVIKLVLDKHKEMTGEE